VRTGSWMGPPKGERAPREGRAFAVKVAPKRLSDLPFSGLVKGCKGHKTHRFENGGTNQIRKRRKREVVLLQPLPQTLYWGLSFGAGGVEN